MKTFQQILVLMFSVFCIVGCSSWAPSSDIVVVATDNKNTEVKAQSNVRDYSRFSAFRHDKSLNDYAQQLVMELNTQQAINKPVAVASFVDFDQSLRTTNSIGNQLAEAVLVELGQLGYPTADINADKNISMNARGNFVFSRAQKERMKDYCCVLSGNLIYEQSGVRVNAKLIDLDSRRILGASTLTIPYFVIDHLGYAHSE